MDAKNDNEKSRFTDAQILAILKQGENGVPVADHWIKEPYLNRPTLGIIGRQTASDDAAHDEARLREGLIDPNSTVSDVWAGTAYRSKANEAFLDKAGRVSQIHHNSP